MKFIPHFPVLLLIYLLVNCSTSKDTELKTEIDMNYTVLKEGNLFGAGEEGFEAGAITANNAEQSNLIIQQMNSINEEIKDDIIPNIHFFDASMVVFIVDKVRGSGGHSITVENITSTGKEIIVYAKNNAPSGPASTVMTQPYIILQLDKSTLPVQLILTE